MNKINPKKYKTPQGYLEYSKFANIINGLIDVDKNRLLNLSVNSKMTKELIAAIKKTFKLNNNSYVAKGDAIGNLCKEWFKDWQKWSYMNLYTSHINLFTVRQSKLSAEKECCEFIENFILDCYEYGACYEGEQTWVIYDIEQFVKNICLELKKFILGNIISDYFNVDMGWYDTPPRKNGYFLGYQKEVFDPIQTWKKELLQVYPDILEYPIEYSVDGGEFERCFYDETFYINNLQTNAIASFVLDPLLMESISKTNPVIGNIDIIPFATQGVIFYPKNKIENLAIDCGGRNLRFTVFCCSKTRISGFHEFLQNGKSEKIYFAYPLSVNVKSTKIIKDVCDTNPVAFYECTLNEQTKIILECGIETDSFEFFDVNQSCSLFWEENAVSHILETKSNGVMYAGQWLLYQIFLYKMIKNEQPSSYECRQAGVIKGKSDKISRSKTGLSPIVIGKDYKPKYKYGQPIGTHASPQTHWRSGHWRQQPIGKKDKPEYKTIWIEPTLINA